MHFPYLIVIYFSLSSYSYHQKYRLQSHKDLAESLGMTPELLQTSYVAAKLNGYLVGVGGVEQFQKEADNFGLTPSQKEYVRHHVEENEGGGLFCWRRQKTCNVKLKKYTEKWGSCERMCGYLRSER